MSDPLPNRVLAPVLAAIGALAGAVAFGLVLRTGIYALVLVGLGTGLGGGLLLRTRQPVNGGISAALALVCAYLTEWWFMPFTDDGSLGFFLVNLGELSLITHVSAVLGAAMAFSMGSGLRIGRRRD